MIPSLRLQDFLAAHFQGTEVFPVCSIFKNSYGIHEGRNSEVGLP